MVEQVAQAAEESLLVVERDSTETVSSAAVWHCTCSSIMDGSQQ